MVWIRLLIASEAPDTYLKCLIEHVVRVQVHITVITLTYTLKTEKMRKLNKKSIKANFSPMSNNSRLTQSMKVDGRKCIN